MHGRSQENTQPESREQGGLGNIIKAGHFKSEMV